MALRRANASSQYDRVPMNLSDFSALFSALTGGKEPFPWQKELFRRFAANDIPSGCDIPTGLGKTLVMAIWLAARVGGAKVPRRLVYVVDRRAVVDQASTEAMNLRAFLDGQPKIKARLGLLDSLPISTLRGQHVDKREWLEDPSMPAIIVGTVDMIGSRLLFEGYRVSRKMRPYHAGLLGADTLVVLDEAHLVPPFERLLNSIARGTKDFGPNDEKLRTTVPEFKLLTLSATGRTSDGSCHGLQKDDFEHKVVKKRLNAPKCLVLKPLVEVLNPQFAAQSAENNQIAGESNAPTESGVGEGSVSEQKKKPTKDNLGDALACGAWELTDKGRKPLRVLVFCDQRQVAQGVERKLKDRAKADQKESRATTEIETELFVGGRRVFEREKARERLKELGFLAGSDVARTKPAFLVATSAAEVGVDLDADHMVCDLVPWERMVQRLGRVNRRGDGDATVIVIVEPEPAPRKKEQDAISKQKAGDELDEKERKLVDGFNERVLEWKNFQTPFEYLPKHGGGFAASPGALLKLKRKAKEDPVLESILDAATTPAPLRPPLTRALVDAWSMTSLKTHTGRPAIDPWLRGWLEDDPPQTAVVWRTHLPVRHRRQPTKKEIEGFFEAAPPLTSELLETRTRDVMEWLGKRSLALLNRAAKGDEGLASKDDVVAFVLARDLTLRRPIRLGDLVVSDDKEKEELNSALEGATLVVDSRFAGLGVGLLDSDENTPPPTADGENWLAEGLVGFRVRCVAAGQPVVRDPNWHERRRFAAEESSEGEPLRWLIIEKWRDEAATEDDRSASRPQLLDQHQSWAERCARQIATRLGLEKEYVEMLAVAARLHDEGKRAKCWQRAFKAPADADYAKTEGPINYSLLDGYRHEFGSLPHLESDERLKSLADENLRELALHIVAAHHGFGRPIIGTSGCEDAPPSLLQERAREVALRFARVQRRWGPWGLAWWEALLRAADQQASRENEKLPSRPETEVRHG
jgi:CRISPR-associated endonuclease/helicase Cas3